MVLLHGLGLGIFQYRYVISHFLTQLPDIPILIPIQPHISQDYFHPQYLEPMLRDETVECLGSLLKNLGWVNEDERGRRREVSVVSHSK